MDCTFQFKADRKSVDCGDFLELTDFTSIQDIVSEIESMGFRRVDLDFPNAEILTGMSRASGNEKLYCVNEYRLDSTDRLEGWSILFGTDDTIEYIELRPYETVPEKRSKFVVWYAPLMGDRRLKNFHEFMEFTRKWWCGSR